MERKLGLRYTCRVESNTDILLSIQMMLNWDQIETGENPTRQRQQQRLRHREVAARAAAGEVEQSIEIERRVELSVGQD